MKIMTSNPIIVNGSVYSSLDGGSALEDIKAFQRWVYYVKKDASIATSKQKDGVDGIFGKRTESAWKKYGEEYSKLVEAATPKPVTTVQTNAPIITETVVDTDIDEQKVGWWKKQSLLNKTLIIGGAFLIFGVVAYTLKQRKKKSSVIKK